MQDQESLQEKIDRYLRGEMNPAEKQAFGQSMESDAELAAEVAQIRDIQEGLAIVAETSFSTIVSEVEDRLDQEGFFSEGDDALLIEGIRQAGLDDLERLVKEVGDDFKKSNDRGTETGRVVSIAEKFTMGRRTLMGIAASVCLLVVAAWLIFKPGSSDTTLYAAYYHTDEDLISSELDLRLEESAFAGQRREDLQFFRQMMQAYQDERYDEVIENFESERQPEIGPEYQMWREYFAAQAYLALNETDTALDLLLPIQSDESFQRQDGVAWYLALIYLRLNQHQLAQDQLIRISPDSDFGGVAAELLESIKKI